MRSRKQGSQEERRGASKRRRRLRIGLAAAAFVLLWMVPSMAPATVEEQRARLPPAADCADEMIAGVWRSHKYNPRYGDWTIFTLDIHRDAENPSQLYGTISNHSWQGGPTQEEPPACAPGAGFHWIVSMDARGTVDAQDNIFFGAYGAWRLDRVFCERGPYGYNLDNLSGRVDHAIHEFQSVNNDGGRSINEPMVFRRVRCHAPESRSSPEVTIEAPDFYPHRVGGCGC